MTSLICAHAFPVPFAQAADIRLDPRSALGGSHRVICDAAKPVACHFHPFPSGLGIQFNVPRCCCSELPVTALGTSYGSGSPNHAMPLGCQARSMVMCLDFFNIILKVLISCNELSTFVHCLSWRTWEMCGRCLRRTLKCVFSAGCELEGCGYEEFLIGFFSVLVVIT